jgi:catechol 2,3-dioxygenase-like lactoylglutathione lyase family enzyme
VITHLDHTGIAVTDLEDARETYTRLGFKLTALSHHEGSPAPGQPVQPWGSANHCAMLRRGYVELLGITNPALFNPVEAMLANYAGPHIVALSSDDADATYFKLRTRADIVTAPRDLGRMVRYGTEGSDERRVAFKLVGIDRASLPEARFQFTQHLTPEVMWQPGLLDHPNGAVAVTAAHMVSNEPIESARRLAVLLDVACEPYPDGSIRVLLQESALAFHGKRGWEAFTKRPFEKPEPSVAGIGIQVTDLEICRDVLQTGGIEVIRDGSTLRVPSSLACGAELIFGT